jgi:hypothetical protein
VGGQAAAGTRHRPAAAGAPRNLQNIVDMSYAVCSMQYAVCSMHYTMHK